MRTTLTLNRDVVGRLKRLSQHRGMRFEDVANTALQAGLRVMEEKLASPQRKSWTTPLSLGTSPIGSLDSIAEALAAAEGEASPLLEPPSQNRP